MADGTWPEPVRDLSLIGLTAAMVLVGVLWAAGAASAGLSGHRVPHGHPFGELAAFAHFDDPSAGWHAPVGPAGMYWPVTFLTIALLALLGYGAWRLWHPRKPDTADDPERIEGLANRRQVRHAAGEKALLRRAATLRPSVVHARPNRPMSACCWGPAAGRGAGRAWRTPSPCSARPEPGKGSTS